MSEIELDRVIKEADELNKYWRENMEQGDFRRVTMSAKEASVYIGISAATLYGMCKRNEIPHKKIRSRVLFNRHQIDMWLNNGERIDPPIQPQALHSGIDKKTLITILEAVLAVLKKS